MSEYIDLARAHSDFEARCFVKLFEKADKGWRGWRDPAWRDVIVDKLQDHVRGLVTGDESQAVDVANLAMFLERMGDEQGETDGG